MSVFKKPERLTCDFETRSQVDLRKSGAYRYAKSPTTEVLCFAYRLPHWATGRTELWTPEYPDLGIYQQGGDFDALFEMFEWLTNGGLVECHNAQFDRLIYENIVVPRYGWPLVPKKQWRCSAAQAAACSLPRGLDDALAAMRLALRKDATGAKVMMKMTKPRKPRKAEREAWQEHHGSKPMTVLFHEDRHLLQQLFDYVRQDVLAEEGLSYVLPDLSDDELELYWLDQEMNDRGFQLDMEAVDAALYMIQEESILLNGELAVVTDGQVEKATQRKQLQIWLEMEGVEIADTTAATLDDLLQNWPSSGSDAARRAVEILRTLGRSSTSKYERMRDQADLADGRIRGGLLYHGASTGRWTGVGVQPQNFPKGSLKAADGEDPNAFVARLWDDIKTLDRDYIVNRHHASMMEVLSHALRSAIVAPDGKELFVADFASIEARVLLWLAGDDDALDVFRRGEDIYLYTAEGIYNRPLTKADKEERQMGKQAVLGLGYQMGAPKFMDTVAKYGIVIEEDFARQVVEAYRAKYWRTKELWRAQEAAAVACVKTKRSVECGKVCWHFHHDFLWCELPSGRQLAYPFAWVSMQETSWGAQKETLQFRSVNPKTRQWQATKTYGGMIVENQCQAAARDLIAESLKRLEHHLTYEPILSVHDEAIAEAVIGAGDVKEFEHLVAETPDWADGLPVAAEAFRADRYHK